jgi:hypothetical protein
MSIDIKWRTTKKSYSLFDFSLFFYYGIFIRNFGPKVTLDQAAAGSNVKSRFEKRYVNYNVLHCYKLIISTVRQCYYTVSLLLRIGWWFSSHLFEVLIVSQFVCQLLTLPVTLFQIRMTRKWSHKVFQLWVSHLSI